MKKIYSCFILFLFAVHILYFGLSFSDTVYSCPQLEGQTVDTGKMTTAGWVFIPDQQHPDRILALKLADPGYLYDEEYYKFNVTICINDDGTCTCSQNDGNYDYHEIMFVSIYSTGDGGFISCDEVPQNVMVMFLSEISSSDPNNPYNRPTPPPEVPFIFREVYGIPMFVILSIGIFSTFISFGLIRTAKPIEYVEEKRKNSEDSKKPRRRRRNFSDL